MREPSRRRRLFRFPWRSSHQIRRDIDEELAFHLEMRARELVERGIPHHVAVQEARRQFGDLEYTKTYCREVDTRHERAAQTTEWLTTLAQDARYAVRSLKKAPAFALIAVLTLALGIGANTAIFSVVYGVLLKPLPFVAPERLVRVLGLDPGGGHPPISPLDLRDYRAEAHSLSALAAFVSAPTTLTGADGEPEHLERAGVSTTFLPMLGVRPVIGSHLTPQEDVGPRSREVMISEGLWRRRYAADARIVGKTIMLDDQPSTVVGVVPDEQQFPPGTDIWSAIALQPEMLNPPLRIARFLRVYGRLAPGATPQSAETELAMIAKRLAAAYPMTNDKLGVEVRDLHQYLVGDLRLPFLVLLGAVALVLLIACANVANLLLVRASARSGEIAIRRAIGATRARVVRQLLTESMLLSLVGAAAGVLVAIWGTGRLVALAQGRLPRFLNVHVDGVVLGVTAAIAILTGLVFGVLPAWRGSDANFTHALSAGRRAGGARSSRRLRRGLVVAQTALSLMLLAGAGLLMRSFILVRAIDPGFKPDGLVTFDLSIRRNPPSIPRPEYRRAFVANLVDRLRTIPGVRGAAVTSALPLSGASFMLNFEIVGQPPSGAKLASEIRAVTPDYFTTMGVRLLRGRLPAESDRNGAPHVAVVNEAAAGQFFGGSALGRRFRLGTDAGDDTEIIGVVANVKQLELAAAVQPELTLVFAQQPMGDFSVVMRTNGDARAVLTEARRIVHGLDPQLAVRQQRSVTEVIASSTAQSRLYVVLLSLFAGAALLLAAVGLYGVVSYAANQRRHEMGIRVALGASSASITRLVLREGMALAVGGLAVGLVGAWWGTRLLTRLISLYNVTWNDPVAFLSGASILLLAGLAACYLPARRAARADPTAAMRAE